MICIWNKPAKRITLRGKKFKIFISQSLSTQTQLLACFFNQISLIKVSQNFIKMCFLLEKKFRSKKLPSHHKRERIFHYFYAKAHFQRLCLSLMLCFLTAHTYILCFSTLKGFTSGSRVFVESFKCFKF